MSILLFKKRQGLTLLEIIIAIIILSVVLIGLLGLSSTALGIANRNKTQIILLNLAKAKAEEIMSFMSNNTTTTLFSRYNGESQTSNLLLADGVTPIPGNYAGFTRNVSVSYVDIVSDTPDGALQGSQQLVPSASPPHASVTVTASKADSGSVKLTLFFFQG